MPESGVIHEEVVVLVTNIENLQENFSKLKSVHGINNFLRHSLTRLGIRTFAFTSFHFDNLSKTNKVTFEFTSANFAVWHQHYHEQNYIEIDSTASKTRNSNIPEFWTVQQQIEMATTKREYQMRLDANKFGAVKGVSIPVHSASADFAELVVVQMQKEAFLQSSSSLIHELMVLAQYYYHHLRAAVNFTLTENTAGLNARQIECLSLTAKGYSLQDIASKMGIKQRTVNYHIQNINKTLGTKNKYLSMQKARDLGLLGE